MALKKLEAFIDHTLLKPEATSMDIQQLCREAITYNFVSVCVNPINIGKASLHLKNSGVKVGTVCGFPLGATTTEIKVNEAEVCENLGAEEIDMVANIGAIREGDWDLVRDDIEAVRKALTGSSILKVILECELLNQDQIRRAAIIAAECGADYVKTSTGFGGVAKIEHVALLFNTVGMKIGIKAAGGIRNLASALAMIEAGASRIGTSSGVDIIKEYISRRKA